MAATIDIGGDRPEYVPVYEQAGGSGTNILVNSGDTVNVFGAIDDSSTAAIATLTAGQNQTFQQAVYMISNSNSNVTLTGPGY